MQIKFELPEDIAQGLKTKWTDLPRGALESLALEACRSNALSAAQLRRLLENSPTLFTKTTTSARRLLGRYDMRPLRICQRMGADVWQLLAREPLPEPAALFHSSGQRSAQ